MNLKVLTANPLQIILEKQAGCLRAEGDVINMEAAGIIAILSSLLGIPLIVFGFIYLNMKGKRTVELERIRKEMLELEIEREKLKLKMVEEENIKYDRIIDGRDKFGV